MQKDFADRDEAIRWIILNQFGRRNLPAHERARLALRLKPILAEKAKEKQLETLKQNATVSQNSVERKPILAEQAKEKEHERKTTSQKSVKSYDTQKDLAAIAGVSHDTIHKVETSTPLSSPL